MITYGNALAGARRKLAGRSGESAGLDARLLLAAATDIDMAVLIARDGDVLPDAAREKFEAYVRRRLDGEPVDRILGEREFWGIPFRIDRSTLSPRPETESLVEAALDFARSASPNLRICDLGAGSGAILIALLTELPEASGVATDISAEALRIARVNAGEHGVESRITFHQGDFASTPGGPFDIVVSNPPYIRSDAIGELASEVRSFDPRVALDGGPDGLAAYRAILSCIDALLAPGGLAAFEIGRDQAEPVTQLCREAGLAGPRVQSDLSGNSRVVTARRAKRKSSIRKKHLEKSDDRASFHQQTRAKPQSWHPISAARQRSPIGWFARVAIA